MTGQGGWTERRPLAGLFAAATMAVRPRLGSLTQAPRWAGEPHSRPQRPTRPDPFPSEALGPRPQGFSCCSVHTRHPHPQWCSLTSSHPTQASLGLPTAPSPVCPLHCPHLAPTRVTVARQTPPGTGLPPTCSRRWQGAAGPQGDIHAEARLRPAFSALSAHGARPLSPRVTTEMSQVGDRPVEGQLPPRGWQRGLGREG